MMGGQYGNTGCGVFKGEIQNNYSKTQTPTFSWNLNFVGNLILFGTKKKYFI